MLIYVANPLYDAVFKYMMEDERIAKTLLSALLQKTVIAVEMRRHEYPNISRDAISMFRVDFAATVLENDGSKKLILIELQKTWLETETLRFRQRMLELDENKYADDAEMAHILHRLQSAAANPDIRNRMNAEDEFFQALEDRDTTIMAKDKIIKEQGAVLEEQKARMEEQDARMKEQDARMKEQDARMKEQNAALEEQKASLRAAVLALSKSGMATEMIAKTLHIEEEKIKEILS